MGFINTMGNENVSAPNMDKKLENGTPILNTNMQKNPRSIALMDVLFMNDQMVGVEKVSSICNYISPFKTRETNDEL
jgi:hypothetical protein